MVRLIHIFFKEFSKLMQEEFEVLPWNSNQPMQRWSVCSSVEIHQGASKEVRYIQPAP